MGACVLEAATLAKPVITKLANSLLNCIRRRANATHFVPLAADKCAFYRVRIIKLAIPVKNRNLQYEQRRVYC